MKSLLDRRKEMKEVREERERELTDDQHARQLAQLLYASSIYSFSISFLFSSAKLEEQNSLLEEYRKSNLEQERQINSLKFDLANTRYVRSHVTVSISFSFLANRLVH
jgi:hypothetical protein